jgi:hypothetical protein
VLAAHNALKAIPGKYAQPDPSIVAHIPKGGVQLAYVGHAEITLALIEIDPLWSWEPIAFDESGRPLITLEGNRLVMWARLTVCGKSMIGVGTCEARKGDPEKELVGDFLRNAAMRFGIGTKLWSKATDADPAGSGGAGGYDKPRRELDPVKHDAGVVALFERVKAAAGTPVADELKQFAHDNNLKLNLPTLAADPTFAAQVADILDKAAS